MALDIIQTPELLREGVARELIHPIQNLRKESGFEVTDRIGTVIYAEGAAGEAIAEALSEHAAYVSAQTLSVSLEQRPLAEAPQEAAQVEWEDTFIRIKVTKTNNN